MMIEDKLTHGQRIRLEALNLATISFPGSTKEEIVSRAATYEAFIKEGKE